MSPQKPDDRKPAPDANAKEPGARPVETTLVIEAEKYVSPNERALAEWARRIRNGGASSS